MTYLPESCQAETFVRLTQHQQDAYVPEKCDVSRIGFFRHLDSMGVVDGDGWIKMIDDEDDHQWWGEFKYIGILRG